MGNLDSNTSKAQLLADLRNEEAGFEALLTEIGEDHMTQPGAAGPWSIKDIVAHLDGWRGWSVQRFRAALHHQSAPTPPWPTDLRTDDEINAWIYAANRDRPVADVLRSSRDIFEQLVATLGAFPEEELRDSSRFPWLGDETFTGPDFFGHFHEEHEADMRAWLERVRRGEV